MAIQDVAGNDLPIGTTGQMLGFDEPPPSPEVLSLRMYKFLLEPIRIEDAKMGGNLFVKRFLEGPQTIWENNQTRIFALSDLWDLTKIEDRLLVFLKNIVGWTKELDVITDELDSVLLRKLIGTSIPLWKNRGTENIILSILFLVTGARNRIWNWFDFKFIIDETGMGEEHDGRDPWMINLPSEGSAVNEMNLRIVDKGDLNRNLVENMLKRLMRPVGERIDVAYIAFLDLFNVKEDDFQWTAQLGSLMVVEDGLAKLEDAGEQLITINTAFGFRPDALSFSHYQVFWRIRGNSGAVTGQDFGGAFHFTDSSNYYRVVIDVFDNEIRWEKVTTGVPSVVVAFDYSTLAGPGLLVDDTFYGIRVEAIPEAGSTRVKVYVDATLVIDSTDSDHIKGSSGLYKSSGPTNVEFDEIELFKLPLDTVLIDINS